MTHPKLVRPAVGAAFFAALVACSSSNDGGGGGEPSVTFTQVYSQIISQRCTDHHSGADPSGGLDMSTQSLAYQHLVGVAALGAPCSDEDPVPTLVVADEHTASLLWQKVAGQQKCGDQMPQGGPYLTTAQINQIAEWIDDGAQND
jgi:hypothetical protein